MLPCVVGTRDVNRHLQCFVGVHLHPHLQYGLSVQPWLPVGLDGDSVKVPYFHNITEVNMIPKTYITHNS